MNGRLLVLGCGSLAREIALAIPLIVSRHDDDFTLMVAARDGARARWIAQSVQARSFAAGVPVFWFAQKENGKQIFTKYEKVATAALVIVAAISLLLFIKGVVTVT